MANALQTLFDYQTLTRQQAREELLSISEGNYSAAELAALLTVYRMRSITIEEIQGFHDALMMLCHQVKLPMDNVLDMVGTGGDGKNTFNITTASSFIVAGCGQPVAKHGNYGATSISGSSNVMQHLGYQFSNDTEKLSRELEQANYCFLHAPLFHPALKEVASVRKNIGIRTFFNLLGPLVNPAKPAYQMVGVYNLETARIYSYFLQDSNTKYSIIHSLDGYDEISLTDDTKVITNKGVQILSARTLGKRSVFANDILGGNSVEEAASTFLKILQGEGTWAHNAVVLANAAMGLLTAEVYSIYEECYAASVASLESGKAYQTFKKLISMQ